MTPAVRAHHLALLLATLACTGATDKGGDTDVVETDDVETDVVETDDTDVVETDDTDVGLPDTGETDPPDDTDPADTDPTASTDDSDPTLSTDESDETDTPGSTDETDTPGSTDDSDPIVIDPHEARNNALLAMCALPTTWTNPAPGQTELWTARSCFPVPEGTTCPSPTTPLPWPEGELLEPCEISELVCVKSFFGEREVWDTASWDSVSPALDPAAFHACCYDVIGVTPRYDCGRPFVQEGHAARAAPTPSTGWSTRAPADLHRAAADRWLADALAEHASIAAFADLALHLLHHGAPASLIADVQAAIADEIRHAEAAFALASRFAGRPVGPGPLPVRSVPVPSLARLAADTVRHGAVGESVAAATAAARLAVATDPEVRAALQQVVTDEARHADLGWRIVHWATEAGGDEVRVAVEAALAAALTTPPALPQEPVAGPWGLCGTDALRHARDAALTLFC